MYIIDKLNLCIDNIRKKIIDNYFSKLFNAAQINKATNFICATKGSMSLSAALLVIPLLMLIGSSVDLVKLNSLRTELQNATDAAALTAARTSNSVTDASKKAAYNVLIANLASNKFQNIEAELGESDTDLGHQLNYNVEAQYKTIFVAIFGVNTIDLSAKASAVSGTKGAEVVFVLDTTGSMAENDKMSQLKSSVNSALNGILNSSGQNINDVKVGVVPFNTQVRITPDTSASWINWGTADVWEYCDYADRTRAIWPQCPIFWYNLDALCVSAPNEIECRNNAIFYDRPIYGNNTSGYFYEQIAKSYVATGSTYAIQSHRMLYKWTNSAWTLIRTDETGDHYGWVGGQSWLTDDSQSDLSGQPTTIAITTAPTYADSSGKTQNFNRLNPFYFDMRYYDGTGTLNGTPVGDIWYANGYGAVQAKTWNYTIYGNGVSRRTRMPATTDQRDKWQGCMIDRNQDYDVSALSPVLANTNSYYYARRCQDLPLEPILGLTNNIANVRTKINALQPAGFTNIAIGVQWGMEVLSDSVPFAEGSVWGEKHHAKYMVLVTDGYNNKNRFTTNVSDVDKRTEKACANAKAKGIEIFVVRLEQGDTNLLKNCATRAGNFYDLSNANSLPDAMKNIFTSINDLRLVR